MESELLDSKERLALERRSQQQLKPLTGDSTGAALAHMRQRLSRAEREGRSARRLTVALFCVSLGGLAAVIAMARPWSKGLDIARSEIGTAAAGRSLSLPVANPQLLTPHLQRDGPGQPPGKPSASRTPSRVSVAKTADTKRGSSGKRAPLGTPAPRVFASPRLPSLAPHAAAHRRGVSSDMSRRVGSFDSWRPRARSRSRWTWSYRGPFRHWRVLRVARPGSPATCWFVDPHGHWWKARCVWSRGIKRGGERK